MSSCGGMWWTVTESQGCGDGGTRGAQVNTTKLISAASASATRGPLFHAMAMAAATGISKKLDCVAEDSLDFACVTKSI